MANHFILREKNPYKVVTAIFYNQTIIARLYLCFLLFYYDFIISLFGHHDLFKVCYTSFGWRKCFPWTFNLEYCGTFTKYSCMFQVEICTNRFLNNNCQECVRAYLSTMIVYLFFTRSRSVIIGRYLPFILL
jgi:hypothetical protein